MAHGPWCRLDFCKSELEHNNNFDGIVYKISDLNKMHIKRLLLIFIPLVGGFKSYIGDEEETGSYHVIDIIQLRTITECHMRCERHERCMFIGVKDGPDDYRSCSLMREKEIGGAGTTQTASVGEQGSSPVVVKPTATVIKKVRHLSLSERTFN